ncbi:MAG: CoA-binding protein [Azoarcus sp.]|nr:CoA-binding protein [Azoarcus sp.]
MIPTDSQLRELLANTRTIAVVGMSPRPERPSHYVAQYMREHGYTIVPVNPGHHEIAGLACYPSLREVPLAIDMVNVFRRAEDTPPIAHEAVAIGAKSLWLQLGIASAESSRIATAGGLEVVMDLCVKVEHARLFEPRE